MTPYAIPPQGRVASMPDFQQRPFFIRVLVPTGDPDGLRIVEKSNWPGVGVVFNRTNYKEVVNRSEFDKTGVYVLVGTSDDSILPTIYVGEGDPVKNRLNQHHGKKDFWDWAVFFVAKDAKGFVVVKGSQLVRDEVQSIHQYMSTLRKDLLAQGVIVNNGQAYTFAQDQVFGSPSTAAGVVLGRTANGRIEWKNSEGKTLKQIQVAAADQEVDE